ncbi:carbon-nitrogen hydrolase family protein [Roseomonas frigidaquae]|uniref:Carbon-nitrogen hydrolase family protein n=1 Tax=Falsiroseomonas frigidaquae TaxID=487318 RepID=A0ABX1F675_9PROT|nr:carbon-nitrogen hydrolase family protein [Falsiroseomonas frigidaquae]NKE47797.1 carbon-nitrogen hydrolase family protein [Falsiroseomonas frigidaquae]
MTPPPPRPLRLGLLAWPVGNPAGVAAFGTRLEGWLDQAGGRADLCVLPEYACVELGAALAGTDAPDEAAELVAMVAHAEAILASMRQAAMRAGVWLLPGTLPMRAANGRIINRAPLIAPDGRMAFQDKTAMTRFEAERWGVSAGAGPAVFDTPWGRIGISICYDVEFPKHARSQVEQGAWLVLAPSCTDSLRGYARVRIGAAARALENQCFVAVTPTVGQAPWSAALDDNHGQAAIFGPPDRGFPEDGVVAAGAMDQPGWLFATLDPTLVEEVRANGAVRNHRDWPRRPLPAPKPASFA